MQDSPSFLMHFTKFIQVFWTGFDVAELHRLADWSWDWEAGTKKTKVCVIRYVTKGPSKASIMLLYKYGEVDKEKSLDQSYQKQNSSDNHI